MSSFWNHKVVLVTGGSTGLGNAIGQAFARAGCRVCLVARDAARLANAAQALDATGTQVCGLPGDITRDEDAARLVAEALERFGRLDVLVNNAGRSGRGTVLETPLAEYQALWELNFLAAVRMTQAAAPHLKQFRGHLVNIGSLASKVAPRYLGAYPASKFPLAAFSQQARLELASDGIHVLFVCPGPLLRDDAAERYAAQAAGLPDTAKRPGGGARLKGIRPEVLAARILTACERRQPEIVMPAKVRLLLALGQIWPSLGDWLLLRNT